MSGSSANRRFLWAPQLSTKAALPSPMLKAEREQRSLAQPLRWTSVLFTRLYVVLFTIFSMVFLLHRSGVYSLLQRSEYLPTVAEEIALPAGPGPLSFKDNLGRRRWTIYIPGPASFPLPQHQYRAMYDASRQLSSQISGPQSKTAIPSRLRNSFNRHSFDDSYMDVEEAQRRGFLPQQPLEIKSLQDGVATNDSGQVCQSSLTFVLGSGDAGFGKSLLALWLAYGAAQQQGRAFFVDDSKWPYGNYNDFFKPIKQPLCYQAPSSQMVPFPKGARHLVVSATSWSWTVGNLGHRRFDVRKSGREHERALFALARRGFSDLFHLKPEDQDFVNQRMSAIRSEAAGADDLPVVGVHVRRGDLHPRDWIYSRDYLPYERYTEAVLEIMQRSRSRDSIGPGSDKKMPVLVMSDDPDTIVQPDLLGPLVDNNYDVQLAQSRIILASQRSLEHKVAVQQESGFFKHVDEASGWEGGFFASLFNGLGKAPTGDSTIDDGTTPDEGITDLKRLVGKSYVLDLAVTGRSDAVVCAVSSSTCRVLGVMMGWDKVNHGSSWVNVDDGQRWTFD